MKPIAILRSPLLLASAAGSLIAADGDRIRAVRLGVESVPKSDNVELSIYQNGSEIDRRDIQALDQGLGGHIELIDTIGRINGHHAWLVGFRGSHFEQQVNGVHDSPVALINGPLKESVTAWDLEFGFAMIPSRNLDIEIMPFIGYGGITTDDTIFSGTEDDPTLMYRTNHSESQGPYREAGVRASVHYRFQSGLEIGAEASYRHGEGHSNLSYTQGSFRYDVTFDGIGYGAVLGYRF